MKVAVITATRAEYGLLYPLIKKLLMDSFFECHVIVTGTHLLKKYGETIDFIVKDGIPIRYRVNIMSEDHMNQDEVIAKGIVEFARLYEKEEYDAVIVLGDRYELFGFCIPALLKNIPIVHIHGGEKTEGAIDEKIRHSITKMSSIHFPSIKQYADRIIQMGESPDFVYSVGALGIDNVLNMDLLSKNDLSQELSVDFNKDVAIVTFHPVTLDNKIEMVQQTENLMGALLKTKLFSIVTMPNSDFGGECIWKIILRYSNMYPKKIKLIKSLGQKRYLSCLKYAKIVVGNSSSGIIETASFRIPTVDIGDRQRGRVAPCNVLHCDCKKEDICHCINKALDPDFIMKIQDCQNPYGDGKTADRMVEILKKVDWKDSRLVQKVFMDK